jgi:hypothetical protein
MTKEGLTCWSLMPLITFSKPQNKFILMARKRHLFVRRSWGCELEKYLHRWYEWIMWVCLRDGKKLVLLLIKS